MIFNDDYLIHRAKIQTHVRETQQKEIESMYAFVENVFDNNANRVDTISTPQCVCPPHPDFLHIFSFLLHCNPSVSYTFFKCGISLSLSTITHRPIYRLCCATLYILLFSIRKKSGSTPHRVDCTWEILKTSFFLFGQLVSCLCDCVCARASFLCWKKKLKNFSTFFAPISNEKQRKQKKNIRDLKNVFVACNVQYILPIFLFSSPYVFICHRECV